MNIKYATYGIVKTINILVTAMLIAVCLLFGWLVVSNIAGFDVPTLGPVRMYVVLSDSMAPFFRADDAILTVKTSPENLKPDDVITFYAFESDTIITHRIVGVTQTNQGYEFTTKGDNNSSEDNFTTPDNRVIGRHMVTMPGFGEFLETVQSRAYIVAVAVALVLVMQYLLSLAGKALKPSANQTGKYLDSEETNCGEATPNEAISN